MSMSDDPRGFRRGQPGNRDYQAPQQQQPARGGRPAQPPRDDRYDHQRQPEPPQARPERPQQEKPQAAFSAYRPEAYAAQDRRPPARQERSEWDDTLPPPPRSIPTADPFPRTPPQSRDPYDSAPSDPYAPASSPRGYEKNDWRQQDPYQDQGANQFPSYYPPHDEPPAGGDVQSVHDRFFAPEPEPERAPPPAPARFRGSFDDHDHHEPEYAPDPRAGYEPAQRHHGTQAFTAVFDDNHDDNHHDSDWDKFDQAPPPAAVRPFHPPATVPDDDLDADFFADEDDYDAEDYPVERGGGRKRLMAAVLVGAVVTGGGLAFMYKSGGNGGDQSEGPSLISADSRPIKEEPAEPGGRDFPNKGKLIYERLAGPADSDAGGGGAKLASGGASSAAAVVPTGATLEERIENALKAQKEDPRDAAGNSADAPRTVRTVTFGPDGSQQEARPGTQRLAAPDGLSNGIIVTSEATASSGRDPSPAEPVEAAPRAKPALRTAAIPQQAAPSISESAGGSGNFFVQIAARNDQDAAMTAFASLQQKYAGVLGNHSPSVRKVDLGDKGVWYRLLVGPMDSKTDADALCEQLKTAGMKGCFARKD